MKQSGPTSERLFTLPELAEQVKTVLGPSYPPAAWDREIPSVTTIRYYQNLRLMDPPLQKRGRLAVYGGRHLAQIVAIKRFQAAGLLLDEIRRRLGSMKPRELYDVIIANPPYAGVERAHKRSTRHRIPGVRKPEAIYDAGAGSGSFLLAASNAPTTWARQAPSAARGDEGGPVTWISAGTGSGKTHVFMSLLREIDKRARGGRLPPRVPVRIPLAPEFEVTVTAHLSKALARTLLRLFREHLQAVVFGLPERRERSAAPSPRRRRPASLRAARPSADSLG